jgi:hypothetical protein
MKKNPITRKIKLGGLTFRKRIREPNAAERKAARKAKKYYDRNKLKIERKAKRRTMLVNKNPTKKKLESVRQKVNQLVEQGKSHTDAYSIVNAKLHH